MARRVTPAMRGGKPRVLVVDDIPEIVELFRSLAPRLEEAGVEVHTETDERAALALLATTPFDLVLSDFRMKHADGLEVLSLARRKNPHGIRVLMTGYNEVPAPLERIREAGVDAYLQKPLRAKELVLLLLGLLHGDEATLSARRRHAREMEAQAAREEPDPGVTRQ